MVSLARPAYNMMSHMENEEPDFPLYPDPQNMFSPQSFPFSVQNFNLENNSSYPYPRPQAAFQSSGDFNATMYATDGPQYGLESPELRGAPSNYSTASGPSATSSAAASPHSIHGHIAPGPEWGPLGLGFSPSIVGYDGFAHSSEYTVAHSGMEDFDSSLNIVKPNGFVGKCQNISTSVSSQPGSPGSSMSTLISSAQVVDSTVTFKPEALLVSATGTNFNDNCSSSPISMSSTSPTFRRPSLPAARSGVPSSAGQPQKPRPLPVSTMSPTSPQLFSTRHESLFFSQSSGSFVPPLESSCWFPLPIMPITYVLCELHCEDQLANVSLSRPIHPPPTIHRASDFCGTVTRCLPTTNISHFTFSIADVTEPTTHQTRKPISLYECSLRISISSTSPTFSGVTPILQQPRQQRGVKGQGPLHIPGLRKGI